MPPEYAITAKTLQSLLGFAWLLPLVGFCVEILGGKLWDRKSKVAAWLAVGCIGAGFLASLTALCVWGSATQWGGISRLEHGNDPLKSTFTGTFYELAHFGKLRIAIDFYIDGLTCTMFTMVTLIATCIHVFATGYMSDELTEDLEDHEVHLSGGRHFHRPGRYYRFFAFLSLFCFSMLGLVLAGNIFQVFIFWELVGVCSYFLIGFYTERKSASTAANKAFIMNRVGDFGFLVGLMILWANFGTFQFAETSPTESRVGLFQMVRDGHGHLRDEGVNDQRVVQLQHADTTGRHSIPYWLLVTAGLGVFAGCIGKSAQFPLQTWLPDAMEGPTPVSALVHSATMVAAGVYLAGRFYPMFLPEVLLVIAYVGCITLFIGATIAIVATDIKRVLAYSTISQLGYMMLALGLGGWFAGLLHLITHAFFKSLMFLCSGSVIYGCHHVQEMPRMGGLRKKMPITAWTMAVGVIAISGLAVYIPFLGLTGFSGFYSKDEIVATALTFQSLNPIHGVLFFVPLITAGITAFYMWRLWFLTFAGKPRDQHVYDHAHESPREMTTPLIILSVFAVCCAWPILAPHSEHESREAPLARWLKSAEPAHVSGGLELAGNIGLNLPSHHAIHEHHETAGLAALAAAALGTVIAYLFYGLQVADPALVRKQFSGVYDFLVDKWKFDLLYDAMFTRPSQVVGRWCQGFDKTVLDGFLHSASSLTVRFAQFDRWFDENFVDRAVNILGEWTQAAGDALKSVQTGRLRDYIAFIALGVVSLFVVLAVTMR